MINEREKARGEAADWHIALHDDPDDGPLRADFEAWLAQSERHRSAWDALGTTIAAIHHMPDDRRGYDRAFVKRPARPRQTRREISASRDWRRGRIVVAAAAASAALLIFPAVQFRFSADHISAAGEVRQVRLADGSSVVLGPDSAIAVDYGEHERSVRLLRGQAHFDVVRDPAHPFHVIARDVRTSVLGTAFDVRMIGDATAVAVSRGRVRVQNDVMTPHLRQDLTAGQSVSVVDGQVQSIEENPALVGSWRSGDVLLRHQTVAQAIDEVRPWFGGKIILMDSKLAQRPLTGIYNLHDPVEAIRLMVDPHGGRIMQITPWLIVVTES